MNFKWSLDHRHGGVGVAVAGVGYATLGEGAASAATPEVTFTKDIAPILQRSCQNCHRPGRSPDVTHSEEGDSGRA